MSAQDNKAVVSYFNERMNKGDTSVIDEVTTSKFVTHIMGTGRDLYRTTYRKVIQIDATLFRMYL